MAKLSEIQLESLTALVKEFDNGSRHAAHRIYDIITDTHSEKPYQFVNATNVRIECTRMRSWRQNRGVPDVTWAVLIVNGLAEKFGIPYLRVAPTELGRACLAAGGVYTKREPVKFTAEPVKFTAEEVFALKVRRIADERDRYRLLVVDRAMRIAQLMRRKAEDIESYGLHGYWSSISEQVINGVKGTIGNMELDTMVRDELRFTRAEERLNFLLTGTVKDNDFN